MIRNKIAAALGTTLCCALLTQPVWAKKHDHAGVYIGGQYNIFDLKVSGVDSETINPLAANFQLGYQFNRYFGLEARAGYGTRQDKTSERGKTAEIENYYGGYLTITLPVTSYVHLYGLVGQTDIKARLRETQEPLDRSKDENISYGGGFKTAPYYGFSFSLEFMHMIDNFDAVSAGLTYKF